MARQIISRVLAMLFLSFPLALAGLAFEREEQKAMETLSHAELVAHLNAGRIDSPYAVIAVVFCAGLLYVGFVEGVAYVLRWGWRQVAESRAN